LDYTTPGQGIIEELAILFALVIIVGILVFIWEYYSIVGFGRCRRASKKAVQRDRNKENLYPGHMSQDSAVIAEKCQASNLTEEERKQYAAVAVGRRGQFPDSGHFDGRDLSAIWLRGERPERRFSVARECPSPHGGVLCHLGGGQ